MCGRSGRWGDTTVGAEPTYMYYIYDWWRCANHEAEAPQWYAISGIYEPLFYAAYLHSDSVARSYSEAGPRPDI